MAGGNQNPYSQGYPPQNNPYGQQYGAPASGQPWVDQPFGSAQPAYYPQHGFVPPAGLPTECFGGFWIRFAAYFIDSLIIGIPLQLLQIMLRVAMGLPAIAQQQLGAPPSTAHAQSEMLVSMIMFPINIGSIWLYYALMHSKKGASIGKLAVGVRVVDENGMFPSFAQATGRYFATILSGCVCLVGYLVAAFHPQKRAWHDQLANTYVVRKEYVNPGQPQ